MHRTAWFLGGLLVWAVVNVPPAAATCAEVHDPLVARACTDDNGNGTPDHAGVWTPVGEARYDETGCGGCPAWLSAQLSAAGAGANAYASCGTGPNQPGCGFTHAGAWTPVAGGWVRTFTNGLDGAGGAPWACVKAYTIWLTVVECKRIAA